MSDWITAWDTLWQVCTSSRLDHGFTKYSKGSPSPTRLKDADIANLPVARVHYFHTAGSENGLEWVAGPGYTHKKDADLAKNSF